MTDSTKEFVGNLIKLYQANKSAKYAVFEQLKRDKPDFFNKIEIDLKLDKILNFIEEGKFKVFLLTGDAGHGKSRLFDRISNKFAQEVRIIEDASAINTDELEAELISIEKFLKDEISFQIPIIMGINEGLLQFYKNKFKNLKEVLNYYLQFELENDYSLREEFESKIIVINLNKGRITEDIFQHILERILSENNWTECGSCVFKDECTILLNIECLRNSNIQKRVFEIFKIIQYTEEYNLTIRRLLSTLSFVITGGLDCDEVSKISTPKERIRKLYYNNMFSGDETEKTLSKVKTLDPIWQNNPQLDNFLYFTNYTEIAQEFYMKKGLIEKRFDDNWFERNQLYKDVRKDKKDFVDSYFTFLKRRFYFEHSQNKFSETLGLLPSRDFSKFLRFLNSDNKIKIIRNLVISLNSQLNVKAVINLLIPDEFISQEENRYHNCYFLEKDKFSLQMEKIPHQIEDIISFFPTYAILYINEFSEFRIKITKRVFEVLEMWRLGSRPSTDYNTTISYLNNAKVHLLAGIKDKNQRMYVYERDIKKEIFTLKAIQKPNKRTEIELEGVH